MSAGLVSSVEKKGQDLFQVSLLDLQRPILLLPLHMVIPLNMPLVSLCVLISSSYKDASQLPPPFAFRVDLGADAGRVGVQPSLPRSGSTTACLEVMWQGSALHPYPHIQSILADAAIPWGSPVVRGLGSRPWQGKLTSLPPSRGSVSPFENLTKANKPLLWKVSIQRHPWFHTCSGGNGLQWS